jgi:GntR family transcriptional regulator, transcriptional repressor for pyruvate dehydrogenase complex
MSHSLQVTRQTRTTIPDGIAREIERQIASGSLQTGDRLPAVDELARGFAVSRASVREALRALATRGLVEVQHGRGTFVRARLPRPDGYASWLAEQQYALQELCELRRAVETTAALLAAAKATPAEIETMIEAQTRMRAAGDDLDEIVLWDSRFHENVLHAAHNRLLEQAMALTIDFLTEARHRMHALPGEVDRSLAAHDRVLQAIQQHDPDGAARAMRDHLRVVEQDLGVRLP